MVFHLNVGTCQAVPESDARPLEEEDGMAAVHHRVLAEHHRQHDQYNGTGSQDDHYKGAGSRNCPPPSLC